VLLFGEEVVGVGQQSFVGLVEALFELWRSAVLNRAQSVVLIGCPRYAGRRCGGLRGAKSKVNDSPAFFDFSNDGVAGE